MNENLKLFRVYDTQKKEYLFTSHKKDTAKIFRDEKEHAHPYFEGAELPPKFMIKQDKYYKYRFQIRRAMDHRKGET